MNSVEIFGLCTGTLSIALLIKQNIWTWPVGIAYTFASLYIFFTAKLYADFALHIFFLIMSFMDGIIGYKEKIITTPSCQSVMRVKKYSYTPYSFAYSLLISLEIYLLNIRMQIYRTGIIQRVS